MFQRRAAIVVVAIIFASVGGILILRGSALTLFTAKGAENGAIAGNATVISDQAGASGSASVKFGTAAQPFMMMSELYNDGAGEAQQFLDLGLANSFIFHAPMTANEKSLIASKKLPLMYFTVPQSAGVSSCYPSTVDPNASDTIKSVAAQSSRPVWQLTLPEFDQSGGCWPRAGGGRPRAQQDRKASYDSWVNFYRNTLGLGSLLNQSDARRGFPLAASCGQGFCPQYAYDMGVNLVFLERIVDEDSGMSPGLAMMRGASRQNDNKPWGIEFSTWRYWTESPTEYSASGRMTGGWSTSWFKRHWYMSFMGGANAHYSEAVDVSTGGQNGGLNPLGTALQQFGNYALKRHPDRGIPQVPMAIVQDHYSGFDPRYGEYDQVEGSWYEQVGYTKGDKMFNNILNVAYPGHNLHGTLVDGGPQTVEEYRERLANGEDPRPWEPLGTSRWGETFDVITNNASLETLKKYKAINLTLGAPLSASFRSVLNQYVQQGGVAVINAKEMTSADESLTGIQLTAGRGSSTSSVWLADNSTATERSYNFTKVNPTSASVIARTSDGSPLITKNNYGSGEVYVTTADYIADATETQMLQAGQKLVDMLSKRYVATRVTGPASTYMINKSANKTYVTIVNNIGSTWNGQIAFDENSGTVKEYTTDSAVASSVQDGKVTSSVSVPGWDVRIFVLER